MKVFTSICFIILISLLPSFSIAQACIDCEGNDSINEGLLLCIKFEGNTSDRGPYKFKSTSMNEPKLATDRHGVVNSCYYFNGTNQFVKYGDILDSFFTTPTLKLSVSGWIKASPPTAPYRSVIIGKAAGGNGPYQWYVFLDNDGRITGAVCSSSMGPTNYIEQKSSAPITPNSWMHFVFTFDGSKPQNQRNNIYLNKTEGYGLPMVGNQGTTTINTNQEITVGAGHAPGNPNQPNNIFAGYIDDLRVYNRVLSTSEISFLYEGGNQINYTKSPDQTVCFNDSLLLSVNGATRYRWYNTSGLIDTTSNELRVKATSSTTYFFEAFKNNCSIKDSIAILLKNTPANAGPDKTICPGDSVSIGTNGSWAALWQPANTLNNFLLKTPIAKPDSSVAYILRATENGCTSFDSMNVSVVDSLIAYAGSDITICSADSVRLSATGGTSFLWQPASLMANSNAANTKAFVPKTTTFILRSSSGSCIAFDTITIAVSAPKAAFTASTLSGFKPLPVTFTNNSVVVSSSYLWDFGDNKGYSNIANPVYTYSLSGNFRIRLIVKDSLGCMDTAYSYIDVAGTSTIFIPNAFSPNSDTNNDLFFPVYDSQFYTKVKGSIWNRWGECIHEFESPVNNWWSGKHKDKECPSGAYLYIMDFTDVNNNTQRFEGFITLIR